MPDVCPARRHEVDDLEGELRPVRTAQIVPLGWAAGRRRPPPWQLRGRYLAWARGATLTLCDGMTLSIAALLVAPAWRGLGYAAAALAMLNAGGMHRLRVCLRISDEIPRLAAFTALPLMLLVPWEHSAVRLALLGAGAAGLLVTMRVTLYAALRLAHRRGRLGERALIVGTGETASAVGRILAEHPDLGLWPMGFIGSPSSGPLSLLPVLGDVSEMAAVVAHWNIQMIIVCFTDRKDADIVSVLRANNWLAAEVCVVPRMYELAAAIPAGCRDDLWGIPLIPLRSSGLRRPGQAAKRAFDLIASTAMLILSAPLLLLLMLLISMSCGRPVFFRQERVTRAGGRMTITKLRTVPVQNSNGQWVVSPEDCTPLGRWLRATHLDELPQLLNVIRGEMSLVGPRPERPHFTSQFAEMVPRYDDRHRVRSGMTGWAQVHGLCGDTSIPERVRFDNYYIENWSLWLDMTILARTLTQPLTGFIRERGQRPTPMAGEPPREPGSG